MFIDYAVSKDCINIHSCQRGCMDCHYHGKIYAPQKNSAAIGWVMCGFRNVCCSDDFEKNQKLLIRKFFDEKPTMKQRLDFMEKYFVYSVVIRPRKECPF